MFLKIKGRIPRAVRFMLLRYGARANLVVITGVRYGNRTRTMGRPELFSTRRIIMYHHRRYTRHLDADNE